MGGCVGVCVRVSGMKTTIDLQIIKMIVWPPLGNQRRPLERGVRRQTNSTQAPNLEQAAVVTMATRVL